jgi:hypothetical protein
MNTRIHLSRGLSASGLVAVAVAVVFSVASLQAQTKRKNPASRIYVASLDGESQINKGDKIENMSNKSAYNAEGSIIETKPKATNALVYSNGTGIFFDPDTRLEVAKFVQEPFTPNRNDLEVEPSISQTDALLARGTIGLCTSKLVAGSTMKYNTTLGSVSIQGGKLVLEADAESTKVSMLEGEGLVRGGNLDLGGHVLHPGEQAIIQRSPGSAANVVTIGPIPKAERASLDDKVFMACAARKTVYFDTKGNEPNTEIAAVPVVPPTLPPPITVSPSQLPQ